MKKPLFLIMAGDGINCERETARAIEVSGGRSEVVHVNDLLAAPETLKKYDGLAVPGGFSFGDELGSGQILALKIRHGLGDAFFDMVRAKKPVIGICNGFQVLVKLGLLPFPDAPERVAALAANEAGGFLDRWVEMDVQDSVCLWTRGLPKQKLRMPMRHGEGRIVLKDGSVYDTLVKQKQIPLLYTEDVNGSHKLIAGLTDPSGVVLGLMPHPEAYMYEGTCAKLHKNVTARGDGALIFTNIIKTLEGKENERRYG